MNTLNPSNRLFLAIVMSLAACSVSHKPEGASDLGTPSKPIDDTVRLNVSEDRVLVTDLVKKGGTLANVSTDELGTDAKALSLTDVGNGLTARLNKALVPGADIKEINATLDKYLTDILEQDIEVASKKETEATELVKKKASLVAMRDKLSVALHSVVSCREATLTTRALSVRTLIESVRADEKTNILLTSNAFHDFKRIEAKEFEKDSEPSVTFQETNDFKRFVSLVLNSKDEVLGFETRAGITASPLTMKGRVRTAVEFKNPNDGEEPTSVMGDQDFSLKQFKADFHFPLAAFASGSYTVVSCVETAAGLMETKTRKLVISSKLSQSPALATTEAAK